MVSCGTPFRRKCSRVPSSASRRIRSRNSSSVSRRCSAFVIPANMASSRLSRNPAVNAAGKCNKSKMTHYPRSGSLDSPDGREEYCGRMPQRPNALCCTFPEDSLLRDQPNRLHSDPRRDRAGGDLDDSHLCRSRAGRTSRRPVSLRIPQDLAKLFPRSEQAGALARHVLGQMQPPGRRLLPIHSPHAIWFVRDRHPHLHRANKGLRKGWFDQSDG